MADDTSLADKQTDQASAAQQTETKQTTQQTDQASDAGAAALKAELTEARKEAARYRTELRDAQTKLSGIEQAQMTESERTAARLKELETTAATQAEALKQATLRAEVTRQARALNIVDDDAAFKLIDTKAITFDAEGAPNNVNALLTELVKGRPWLVGVTGSTSAANASKEDPIAHEAEIKRVVYGQNAIPFGLSQATLHGGGVVFNPQD